MRLTTQEEKENKPIQVYAENSMNAKYLESEDDHKEYY